MKKLLAMLTTITSLSSMTPIILANAPAKIPENKIVNNEINYQQTNNLENLSRNKRANQKRNLRNLVSYTNLGEIKDLNIETIRRAIHCNNGNIPFSVIERIKIKIESSSYASIWIRDEWEDDYFGSTYVYFRVNPNLQECSSSESSYNSSNDSEKDEL